MCKFHITNDIGQLASPNFYLVLILKYFGNFKYNLPIIPTKNLRISKINLKHLNKYAKFLEVNAISRRI